MAFTDEQRMLAWTKKYGSATQGLDPFGRLICKDDFDVDHIWPESKGGKDVLENAMPMHKESNQAKADKFIGEVNCKKFEVKWDGSRSGIGTLYVEGQYVFNT